MSIDDYSLRHLDKMPPKDGKKSSKANKPEAAAGLPSFSTVEEEQQPLTANNNDALDPALRQTIQEIQQRTGLSLTRNTPPNKWNHK